MQKFYFFIITLCVVLHADSASDALFRDVKTPLICDLATSHCESINNDESAKFSLSDVASAMKPNTLSISGISRELKNPVVQISGISMFMGITKAKLERADDGTYRAKIMLSGCTSPVMRYKISLLEDGRESGHYVYLDLRKSTR